MLSLISSYPEDQVRIVGLKCPVIPVRNCDGMYLIAYGNVNDLFPPYLGSLSSWELETRFVELNFAIHDETRLRYLVSRL